MTSRVSTLTGVKQENTPQSSAQPGQGPGGENCPEGSYSALRSHLMPGRKNFYSTGKSSLGPGAAGPGTRGKHPVFGGQQCLHHGDRRDVRREAI